jgi:predicted DNA-binding transcriptional regulator AlpA
MNSDECSGGRQSPAVASTPHAVALSYWVNEPLPAWEQLLSARDLARLTRRPRWLLMSLMLIGRFPRRCRYHGRSIGWLRADVLDWMTRELPPVRTAAHARQPCSRRQRLQQMCLPLERVRDCGTTRNNGENSRCSR